MTDGDPRIEALARVADGFGKIETFTRLIQTSGVASLQSMLQPLITDLTTKFTAAAAGLTEIKDDIAEASRKSDYTQMLEDRLAKTTEVLESLNGIKKEAETRKGEADTLRAKQGENKKSLERAQREAETWKGQADEWRSKNDETKASLERVEKEAETWKGEADKWQSSHDEIKGSLERVRCEAESRKGEVDELQSKNDETSTCLERVEREAEILKGEVDRWKSEHGEIEASLERLQDEAEIRKDEADARLRELSEDLEQCQEDLSSSKRELKDLENATLAKDSELEELLARSLADYEAASSSLQQTRRSYGMCISARNKLEADVKKLRSGSMISELQKEFDQKLAIKDKEVSDTAAAVTQLQGELGSLRISHDTSCQELQQQLRRAAGDLETSRQRTEFLERSVEHVTKVATAHETSEGILRSEVEQLQQQLATAKRLSLSTTQADVAGSRVTEPPVETSASADDEQVDRRPTKRKRTAGTEASDASLTVRPQMAQSDARTKANEIRALMKPQWSITDKEEETLMDQLTSLFSKKAKVSDKLQAIDRCVVGILNTEPPNPRPCLFALLVRRNGGEGGPQMTSADCPYCTERPDERICCYATYAEGVASAFGPRVGGKVKDTRWKEKPKPYTDEQEVRFLLHKRACGDV